MSLEACSICSRHVRNETNCPFCGAALGMRAARRPLTGVITRAAIVGAGLAFGGCESSSVPSYGFPIFEDAAADDAGDDAGTVALPDASTNEPETGAIPPYGVPPRPDGG